MSRSACDLIAGLGFAIATRVSPLYSVNQHTKFLHGLARAFPERLGADWMASTVDGLPVFSFLVYAIVRFVTPLAFVALEYGLLAVLGWALYRLMWSVSAAPRRGMVLAICVVLLAVAPGRRLMTGVASQYLVGGYLQPSEFGVLFLLSLALAGTRPRLALLLAAAPAAVLPAYIPIAILMVVVQGRILWRRRSNRDIAVLAAVTLILVAPQVDLLLRFAQQDSHLKQEALRIIAFERIPHHSLPRVWFDTMALGKLALALAAIRLAPTGTVRQTLVALTGLSVVGAAFVAVTDNVGMALLAPWRASVVVMPVSLAVLLARGAPALLDGLARLPGDARVGRIGTALLAVGAVGLTVNSLVSDAKRNARIVTDPVALAARDRPATGRLYLTDPSDAGFRLAAMAPQFVTRKTHPYLAHEVIEWRRRTIMATAAYGGGRAAPAIDCAALRALVIAYPVTHVVVPARLGASTGCPFLEPVTDGPPRLLAVDRARLADLPIPLHPGGAGATESGHSYAKGLP